ncbi:hypothetical protein ACHAWF_012080 [Thalassiosira exigua]
MIGPRRVGVALLLAGAGGSSSRARAFSLGAAPGRRPSGTSGVGRAVAEEGGDDRPASPSGGPSGGPLALAVALVLLCATADPASAEPFDERIPSPIPTGSSAPAAGSGRGLADTDAFKMLPRKPAYSGAVKELMDLRDLQDARLDACADKGKFWEQCFMYGQSDGVDVDAPGSGGVGGRMDNQLISPVGSLEPPRETRKIPTW